MACFLNSNCNQYGRGLKSFFKRLILVAVIQIIGWFAYTYIEEGFSLTDCVFNRARIQKVVESKGAMKDNTKAKIDTFLKLYATLNGSLTKQNFEIYNEEFSKYFKVPVPAKHASVGEICTKWYLFTAITLTTVGYGNVVPKTKAGKYLFFPYCLIGIPTMLLFLAYIGKILSALSHSILVLISCKTGGDRNVKHKELKSFICSFLLLWAWIIIEALQSHLWQGSKLTFVDGIYFFFISFTTIGYGDITSPMQQILFEFRLYVGLSLMSGVVNSFQALYQKMNNADGVGRHKRCHCCSCHTGRVRMTENEETITVKNNDSYRGDARQVSSQKEE